LVLGSLSASRHSRSNPNRDFLTSKGLHIEEVDKGRPLHRKLRDGRAKELGDRLLGFSAGRAGERVGLHFCIAQPLAIEA
jgi:hypothetical protein